MKQFLARTNRRLTEGCQSLLRVASRVVRQVFGSISWSAPAWLQRVTRKWRTFHAARPFVSTGAILGLFALSCAGTWGWHCYHLPKSHRVTVDIDRDSRNET